MGWIYYVVVLVMLIFSAFFSASEIAMNAANRMRLRRAAGEEDTADEGAEFSAKEKKKGSFTARLALHISKNFTRPLSAILIGNNLANIAASTAATTIMLSWLGNWGKINDPESLDAIASLLSTVIMTLIILIFGEIVPKLLAKQNADKVACAVAVPVKFFEILFSPLVLIVTGFVGLLRHLWGKDNPEDEPTVTEEELSSIIEKVEEEGVIDEERGELLQSTLEFPDTTVQEIYTPRIDVLAIDIDDDPKTIEAIVEGSRYSRLPVYEESIDNIIGILNLNHYYKARLSENGKTLTAKDIRPMLLDCCMMHKTMKLPAALEKMRKTKMHLAIVIDEFGGNMGIVTMEDILEELVGDIWDESDEIRQELTKTGENTYEVSGDMNLDDFFSEVEVRPGNDFACEYSTVGGWVVETLEANPHVGDSFVFQNLCIVVAEMDDMRVVRVTVLISKVENEEE